MLHEYDGGFVMQGDALSQLKNLPDETIQCVVTSPPYYGLRDYGVEGQVGLEPTVREYLDRLLEVFSEVKRVLTKDGVCFVNLGDSYSGSWGNYGGQNRGKGSQREITSGSQVAQPSYEGLEKMRPPTSLNTGIPKKSLMQVPSRFAIAMTDELGFVLRNEIIWHKPSCMPYSGKDRFTVDFEPVYFFSKNPKYKFNQQLDPYISKPSAPRDKASEKYEGTGLFSAGPRDYYSQGGKNKRTTWSVAFEPQKEKHYASYPTRLIEPMILAGSDEGDIVLDPFAGTGTTMLVAKRLKRNSIGIELNPDYVDIILKRFTK